MHRDVASGFNWNLTWVDYKNGFGSSDSTDFWMGLERLYLLTTSGNYRLRMEWRHLATNLWFSIEYWHFYIDNEAANYMMHVEGYVHGDDGRALYVCDSLLHWLCLSVCLSVCLKKIDTKSMTKMMMNII